MATHPGQSLLPTHTTLLQFYDNPPAGDIITGDRGNSTTASVTPVTPPNERQLPRHIIQDRQMCQALTTSARDYLSNSTTPPGPLPVFYYSTQEYLNVSIGDETRNIDMFGLVSAYVRQFVQVADELEPGDIQVIPCDNEGAIRPNRKIVRKGVDKVIVEMKSIAAFDAHIGEIQNLARANNGQGTEIIFSGHEIKGRSIIFKLGKHMIDRNVSWGLLVAGNQFMVFYIDKRMDGTDIYHHLVISSVHPTFPQTTTPNTPGLIQILIALLLGNAPIIQYTPPRAAVRTTYLKRTRSATASKKSPNDTGKKASGSGGKVRGHYSHRTGLEAAMETLLDEIQLCTLSFPNSGLPNRELGLTHINAQDVEEIMSGVVENLPETDPYSKGYHPITFGSERAGRLLACERLGSGGCGEVYDSHLIVDGSNAHCAAKVVEHEFSLFYLEVFAYEQLRGRQFVPKFFGAFAGMWPTGPLGVILMERLDKIFKSYEEMDTEEKHGALECLMQLHQAGLGHGDVSPRNFGARNGEMIILDFSQSGLCRPVDPSGAHDDCGEVRYLKKYLFGNGKG